MTHTMPLLSSFLLLKYLICSTYKKPLLLTEYLFYFYSYVNPEFYHYFRSQRNKTINTVTCNSSFFIYQGNSYCDIRITPFSVGKKLGIFSKTRKLFLDKKDKQCCVVYYICYSIQQVFD